MLVHRLPRRESIVGPRSRCTHCHHTLGAFDLIPVVSFLLLAGKCRHCQAQLSWRYPLLELGAGAFAAAAAEAGGWPAGTAALCIWVAGAVALALNGRQRRASESGFSLVEVLVAIGLLAFLLLPALDAVNVTGHAVLATQRKALASGLAQGRFAELASMAAAGIDQLDGLSGDSENVVVTTGASTTDTFEVLTEVEQIPYDAEHPMYDPGDPTAVNPAIRRVTVTVTCPTCNARFGLPMRPFEASTVLR
ncbi:MAG TPA: prepilin peptidase [Symbiobacteriaceae bacterium]|nr:prepilin peptidase [Symbiobacteriaceae bacterium]